MNSSFSVKTDKCLADLRDISPLLLILLGHVAYYCKQKKLPMVITRVIDKRIEGVSKTDVHEDGRAFDMSVIGWDLDSIKACESHMNETFGEKLGAISISDGKPRVCVYHVGTGPHFHWQVRRM